MAGRGEAQRGGALVARSDVPGAAAKSERLLQVLAVLAKVPQATVHDLAETTEIPVSTLYRLLGPLVASGFVQKTSSRHYGAGPIAVQLSERYRDTTLASGSITPHLRRLAEESGELAAYLVMHGTEAVCVEAVESRHTLRCSYSAGASQPLLRGATATALLSMLPAASRHAIFEHYALPPAEQHSIERACQQAAVDGYAVSTGALDVGIWGASAPVLSHDGALLGVVTLMAPVERSAGRTAPLIRLVRGTASSLSGGLR